ANCCLDSGSGGCSVTACDCALQYNVWTADSSPDNTAALQHSFLDGGSSFFNKTQSLGARAVRGVAAPPADDACSSATVIAALPCTDTRATFTATKSPDDPLQSCFAQTSQSVWYSLTAPVSGTYLVDTLGSTYDTVLSASTASCGGLDEIACNDDDDAAP